MMVDGRCISKDFTSFTPNWRGGAGLAYSRDGGSLDYLVPEGWLDPQQIKAVALTENGDGNGDRYFEYDALGRLTKYRDFDDDPYGTRQTMAYAYDAAGNLVTKTDYEGGVFTYAYTDRNQVSTITGPESQTWTYEYNALGQVETVTNPNSTGSVYLYDNQNRQTTIWDIGAGFVTLDAFTYTLDASGNILTATNTDGSQWEYGYDQRNRLTTANRKNRATSPDIVAEYGFAYDAADNLVTKTGPYEDNFNDESLSDWYVAPGDGDWSAANFYLTKTSSGPGQINLFHSDGDFDAWFSYYCDSDPDYMLVRFRMADWNNYLELLIEGSDMKVRQWVSGSMTVLDTETAGATDTGSWYTVHIQCDGTNVKVWRIEEGNPPSQVFDLGAGDGVSITTTDRLNFQVGAGATFAIDDVRLVTSSLSKTTALAYNGGNELTTETSGAMTKTYTYDAYGRRSTKAQAAEGLQALYTYGYDNKLQSVTTNFPDEDATVEHLYDGLGKLRRISSPGTGNTAWLRWDKGWNPVGMYQDASGVPGALNIGFVLHPQQDAAPPLSYRLFGEGNALFNFYGSYDNIGSLRALRWDYYDAALLGAAEYAPYGEPYDQSMMISLYGYAGHFSDAGVGMSFAPYRWYDPEIARWMARDPKNTREDGAQGNAYCYTSDPINSADPLGLEPVWGEPKCTPNQRTKIMLSLKKYCDKLGGAGGKFSCCMKDGGAMASSLSNLCNNLSTTTIHCMPSGGRCTPDECGYADLPGTHVYLCPHGLEDTGSGSDQCDALGCTLLHELAHNTGSDEDTAQKVEKCLGCARAQRHKNGS